MTIRSAVSLCIAAGLLGCSQPYEGRIASQLNEAGLPQPMAACMAERWVDRLNVMQLREISRVSADLKTEGRSLTDGRLVQRVAEIDDPEIYEVVTLSAARCALSR